MFNPRCPRCGVRTKKVRENGLPFYRYKCVPCCDSSARENRQRELEERIAKLENKEQADHE
jgi:transposase-like protein